MINDDKFQEIKGEVLKLFPLFTFKFVKNKNSYKCIIQECPYDLLGLIKEYYDVHMNLKYNEDIKIVIQEKSERLFKEKSIPLNYKIEDYFSKDIDLVNELLLLWAILTNGSNMNRKSLLPVFYVELSVKVK